MKELRKNDILVRKFTIDDIEHKINMINDQKNNKFLHYQLPLKYENTINWYKKNINNKNRLDCTIEYKKAFAGVIGLLNIDNINNEAEYYICLDYNYTNKGIAYEASQLLIKYAFKEMNLNKIYLYTEQGNHKAQKLFEKIGFSKKSLLINDIDYNNRKINRYLYELYGSKNNV